MLLPCDPYIRVPAVGELSATPPVVIRRDREPPEHGYHRLHGTNTDKPIGVSMVIATRRRIAVVLSNQKRPIRQKSRDLCRHTEQIRVVTAKIRGHAVPAVCDLSPTPPVVIRRDREPPEHGYHRFHRTNTDKPIGVPPAASSSPTEPAPVATTLRVATA